jgi:hypothetical protein
MDRRVLVVDDDPSIQLLVTFGLQDEGYEVRAASNGTSGLAELEVWRPGLVVLDPIWRLFQSSCSPRVISRGSTLTCFRRRLSSPNRFTSDTCWPW